MKRVKGIGGVFFHCKDPGAVKEWYRRHLGIEAEKYGAAFVWRDHEDPTKECSTVWAPFPASTQYFLPSTKPFMINYRVENLVELLEELKREGVTVVGTVQEFPYGKFGWIMDPEGNKIELWEPNDSALS